MRRWRMPSRLLTASGAQNTSGPVTEAPPSPLHTPYYAGRYLHVHARTLANWRCLGKGPPYVRSGSRVLYKQEDLDAFIEAHLYADRAEERERRAR